MIIPQTEIEKKRAAWWAEHYKIGMSFSELCQLNEQLICLFPMTEEERKQRAEEMENLPAFVL
jgi:hypothetical protein